MAAAGLCSAYVAYCIDRSLSTAYKTLAGGDTLYVFDDVMGMTVSHAFAMGAFLVFCFFAVINAISWWKLRRLVDDGPPHYETAMKSTFDGSAMYVIVYDEPEIRLTNGYVYGGFTSIDSPESEDAVENCSWTTEAEDKNEELEND
ncbi:hypothetical protein TALC_00263 [Thermoplasmatales archaeon BRNA1]|nr:hypothetical protein TALC_00263 [Thermoplasmatales archaeon BRNA1]